MRTTSHLPVAVLSTPVHQPVAGLDCGQATINKHLGHNFALVLRAHAHQYRRQTHELSPFPSVTARALLILVRLFFLPRPSTVHPCPSLVHFHSHPNSPHYTPAVVIVAHFFQRFLIACLTIPLTTFLPSDLPFLHRSSFTLPSRLPQQTAPAG